MSVFTFHSGTILILALFIPIMWGVVFYIPLWYDSNLSKSAFVSQYLSFTFHSGTILMLRPNRPSHLHLCFTFHSGTILMGAGGLPPYPSESFTFHSGTILIHHARLLPCVWVCFTFHSGTILIWPLFYYRNTLFSSTVLSTSNFILYFASMKF